MDGPSLGFDFFVCFVLLCLPYLDIMVSSIAIMTGMPAFRSMSSADMTDSADVCRNMALQFFTISGNFTARILLKSHSELGAPFFLLFLIWKPLSIFEV